MDPTCGLVDKFRDLALKLIGEQILYLIYYHKNIEQLNRLLVELTLERSSIQRRIDEAENNVEQIEEKVLHWLGEIDEILKQIHEFHEEESQAKTECSITSCPNPWLRYKLSKRAKAMVQEVAEINGKRNFDRISYRVPPPSMPNLTKRESNEGIDSRVPIMNQIMEALRNPSVNMIGLCGPGGVGKTTIAKEVAKNQKMFEKVIMETVSQELNVEKIQGQIGEKLGMQLNENNKDVRASRLRERLKKEKNMLLILDDLWDELDLGEVGISFVDVENDSKKNEENDSEKNEGCKILLISRNKMLLSGRMKCQRVVEVGVLSEDEALELFKKIAELSTDSSSPELISIATEIVRKCGGLPIAIATAAKTLRNNKDINEWEDARKRLNNPFRRNNTLTREVDSVLKWSYDRLSSPEYKHIFLLAAMLSHDPSIEDLLMYSVGLDILDGIENMEDARIRISATKLLSSLKKLEVLYMGNSFDRWKVEGSSEADENASLDELKDLPISSLDIQIPDVSMLSGNLFLKMKLKRYRIFIGKRWEWQGNYETSKILRLELQSSIDLKARLRKLLEGVEDLHLYGSKGLENVLYSHDARGFSCLRHLQIESNDDIKYIVLNSAHHEDAFPILESLKLKNLKALEKLYEGPNAIVFRQLHILKMKNLPALTADPCIRDRGTNNASNKIFKSLFNNKVLFPNLEILKLSNLKHMIPLIWDDQLSHNSFSNLKRLSVKSCGFEKLVPLHVLKCLNNLEELEVMDCDILEKVFDFEDLNDYNKMESSSVAQPLKRLKLWNLPKLKNVWSDHYQGNVSFQSLRSIDVSDCERLTNMFPASIAKGMLRDLEELQIDGCGIDVIVAKDQIFESVAAAFEFPRLISLQLSHLPNLSNFYPQRHTLEWPQLQQLSIQYCDVLELFEKKVSSSSEIHEEENTVASKHPLLPHDKVIGKLEELKLPGKQVEVIGSGQFPMYHFPKVKVLYVYAEESKTILYRSLWKSFPKLEELQLSGDFEEVFRGDDVAVPFAKLTLMNISNMISLSPSFVSSPNLTHLQVTSYKFTTLMTSSTARSLVHLTCLSISWCYEIEEIITKQEGDDDEDKEIVFNKLQLLELFDLSRLKRFCGYNYTFKFPLLDQIIITRCPKFKIFSPVLVDAPSLKSVQLSQGWGERHEILDTNLHKTFYQQRFVASRELVLDEDEAIMIRNDQFPAEVCPEIKILRIERFVDEWVIFPYTLLERFPKLNELHVEDCSFEEIFPSHAPSSTSFDNLTVLKVSKCRQLVYLVTNSTARSLVKLETLEISFCEKMEEIARKETDEEVEGGITFNGLRILKLTHLPRLKIHKKESILTSKYPLLSRHDKGREAEMMGSGQFLMFSMFQSFPSLEELELWGDFKEVSARHDVVALAPPLSKLTLSNISSTISLTSYLVYLSTLTHLKVTNCYTLTTLMTSSTAQSLVHLTHLSIRNCYQMEEIISMHEGEDDENNEIVFNKLEFLELEDLSSLKRFCRHNYTFKFPLLGQLIIKECPKFNRFSPGFIDTPSLRSVQLSQDWKSHHEIWDPNLNKTFYQQRFVASGKLVLHEDDASMIRNDQFPADHCPEVEILRIERFVDEWVTFPYTLLERFPNLDELHVEDSSFEEIFPSHAHIVDQIPPFKKLYLDNLDKLKNIWRDDSHLPPFQNQEILDVETCSNLVTLAPSSTSFENLTVLKVSNCHQLIYLMTNSTAKNLVNLETLEINYCEKMEEIVRKGTDEDVEGGITFNGLRILKLTGLPRLKVEEDKRDLNIEGRTTNTGSKNNFRSLFSHNKVFLPKLEVLELSSLDYLIPLTWDNQLSHNSFSNHHQGAISVAPSLVSSPNLTHLDVKFCDGFTTLMTSSTARSLIHLTRLLVGYCNKMEKIITMQEGEGDENKEIIFIKLKFLELEHLPKLKRFCAHNYTFKFPLLDELIIKECPKLKIFSPGVIDTPSLKSVQLWQDWEKHHEIWDTNLNKTFYHQRFVASRELVLDEDEAIMIRNDQFPAKVCPEVEILRIERFVDEWVIFPYTLLERFPKLNELHVEDSSFEEIFPSNAHIVDQIPPFKELYLANLTVLKVSKCHQLICLVTNSTTKSLVNLETLEIDDCEKLEEIVKKEANEDVERGITFNGLRIIKLANLPRLKAEEDKRDFNIEDRATNTGCRNIFRSLFSHNKVLLPKLEKLELSNLLNNLISLIWDDQLLHNSFSNLKTLIVKSCGFLKVVPLHVLKSLKNLEKLEVSYCDRLEMVFGFQDLNDYDKEMESSQVVVPLNLTRLEVTGCCGLTTLMTSSAAPSLVHITHISISNCNKIEEILTKPEGEYEEDKEIFFNKMKFLELDNLPRLKNFCGYSYTFRFPLLEDVIISECPQLAMFCSGAIYAPQLRSVRVDRYEPHEVIWMTNLNNTIQHLFTFEEVISTTWSTVLNAKTITIITDVFPQVRTLYVDSFLDEGVTFPYSSLERFPKLDELYVEHCSFREIFLSHDKIIVFMGKIPRFRELHIAYLDQLKNIWKDDSQLPSIHQNLTELEVKSCCNLVKLAPSSASFQNLWKLSVSGCHQLIHLVTTSTAKSLMSLKELEINDCKKMEEIVMNETNEDAGGAITFNQLQKIKLTDMSSLKMFSSQSHTFVCPELGEIQITGCPQMKMFCPGVLETPKLSKVKIEGQDMEWKDKDQDLNKTIEMLSSAKDSVNI